MKEQKNEGTKERKKEQKNEIKGEGMKEQKNWRFERTKELKNGRK